MNLKEIEIVFQKEACQVFEEFAQTGNKNESGGILLGKVRKNKIVITLATKPTKWDSSTRYSFIRHKKSAQKFTNIEFYRSKGTVIYLGEWHTHPEKYPTPSKTDVEMISQQFHENIINERFLLMVIVGLENNFYAVYDGRTFHPINSRKIHLSD